MQVPEPQGTHPPPENVGGFREGFEDLNFWPLTGVILTLSQGVILLLPRPQAWLGALSCFDFNPDPGRKTCVPYAALGLLSS